MPEGGGGKDRWPGRLDHADGRLKRRDSPAGEKKLKGSQYRTQQSAGSRRKDSRGRSMYISDICDICSS